MLRRKSWVNRKEKTMGKEKTKQAWAGRHCMSFGGHLGGSSLIRRPNLCFGVLSDNTRDMGKMRLLPT